MEEKIRDRLSYIIRKDDMKNVSVKMGTDGPYITLNVHGWSVSKTSKIMEKMLLLEKEAFSLNVIHGYRHGTEIKQMLCRFTHARLLKSRGYNENPGITHIKFNAA